MADSNFIKDNASITTLFLMEKSTDFKPKSSYFDLFVPTMGHLSTLPSWSLLPTKDENKPSQFTTLKEALDLYEKNHLN